METPEVKAPRKISRRDFLKLSALGLGGAVLASSSSSSIAPSNPQETNQLSVASEATTGKFTEQIAEASPGERTIRLVEPGTAIEMPQVVVDVLGGSSETEVIEINENTKKRILETARMMPFLPYICDEIAVLSHPKFTRILENGEHISAGNSFCVGISSIAKKDKKKEYNVENSVLRMVLFLPPDMIEGNLDKKITHFSNVPYAKAEMPETLGDYLDWLVLHEGRHFIDYYQRFRDTGYCPALYGQSTTCEDLTKVLEGSFANQYLADLSNFSQFASLHDLENVGQSYLNSDEMGSAVSRRRVGSTEYESKPGGKFLVNYDDGKYMFQSGLVREGYIPPEVRNLSDLAPKIQSGKIPRLYAFFNPIYEIEAEYWTWYMFNEKKGSLKFTELLPEDVRYFSQMRENITKSAIPAQVAV